MTTERRESKTLDKTLTEAIQDYLGTLKPDDKASRQQELRVFAKWFGDGRTLGDLKPHEVESYAERLTLAAVDAAGRLSPLRDFLSYANKEGMTPMNLATHIKVRKTGGKAAGKTATRVQGELIQLTSEGFLAKQQELDELRSQRTDIADALRHARADGDIRENAPLEDERRRQSFVEGRIRDLEAELKRSQIIQGDQVITSRAGIGSIVTLWDLVSEQQIRYTLVNTNEANIRAQKISVQSPIGRALIDRTVGEVVEVQAPSGVIRYRLDAIERVRSS
ncbi:MAG: transcription elongation factor GreA [Chloroflexi bacterium]|nr:transcription elongation factor GreA [Chloroflexota bacterium]